MNGLIVFTSIGTYPAIWRCGVSYGRCDTQSFRLVFFRRREKADVDQRKSSLWRKRLILLENLRENFLSCTYLRYRDQPKLPKQQLIKILREKNQAHEKIQVGEIPHVCFPNRMRRESFSHFKMMFKSGEQVAGLNRGERRRGVCYSNQTTHKQ